VAGVTHTLALAEVFDCSEHVLCNGFLVLNDFLNDDSFREGLFDTLGHDRFGSSVKEFLLTVAEWVSLHVSSGAGYARVCLPVVVTGLLFTGAKIAVRLLVHHGSVAFFFQRSSGGVKDVLSRHGVTSGDTEGVVLLYHLLGPLVSTLVALAKRLTHGGGILSFLGVIETISKTIQVLSLNHDIDGIGTLSRAAISVSLWHVRLTLLKTGMHHNLTRCHIVCLTVLTDVGGSAEVASSLKSINVRTD
jgi:hypothetical protein